MNANTPKFAVKLKLSTMMTHLSNAASIENIEKEEEEEGKGEGEGEDNNNNILKDLDIYSLAESHLWDEIDPFGIYLLQICGVVQ